MTIYFWCTSEYDSLEQELLAAKYTWGSVRDLILGTLCSKKDKMKAFMIEIPIASFIEVENHTESYQPLPAISAWISQLASLEPRYIKI